MASDYSDSVKDLLRNAGWYEGRRVPIVLPPSLRPFAAAREVLVEFGGLHIGQCAPGIDCSTSDVEIDPTLGAHVMSELDSLGQFLARSFFPLGEVCLGHGFIVIDDEGRIYLLSDELESFASTFARSLELLLLGKNPQKEDIESAWGKRERWRSPIGGKTDIKEL